MLKFQDFSVTKILREINAGESRSSSIAIIALFGALNCVNLVEFSLQKVQKCIKFKNSKPLDVEKRQILRF